MSELASEPLSTGPAPSGINYADGAESAVLRALRAAADVSAGSTELARQIRSWELSYHFSPQRLGLLAPLRLRPGARALDLGCGTGVLSRALGEAGLDVLGVEGAEDRAAAARERCRDLPGVRIVQGAVERELAGAEPVDLALLCGVLEYSPQFGDGPEALLRLVSGALTESGAVVLAIENQLGLGYLLGRDEDHHGKAWIGLADYPGDRAVPTTWTRSRLAELLAGAGLTAQRWLLPYPDYKHPRVVLDAEVFDRADAVDVVDKLVRDPLQGAFGGGLAAGPGRVLNRLVTGEGFGAEVAPSFLVVAGRSPEAVAAVTEPGLAWLVSGNRRPNWRRTRRLDADLVLRATHSPAAEPMRWLRQQAPTEEPWVPGRPVDQLLLDALHRGDRAELKRLLVAWKDICLAQASPLTAEDERHPYLPGREGVPVLPADLLDAHPGNVIVRADGEAIRVDREWRAGTGVDAELALLRALLEFSRELAASGAPHPWPADTTMRGLLRELCEPIGLTAALDRRGAELLRAEAALQELVTGVDPEQAVRSMSAELDRVPGIPLWTVQGGLDTIRHTFRRHDELLGELAEARTELDRLRAELARGREQAAEELAGAEQDKAELRHTLGMARASLDRMDDRIGMVFAELAEVNREAERERQAAREAQERNAQTAGQLHALTERLVRTRARLDLLENSSLVRAGHRYLWPAARAARGVRDLALGRNGEEPDGVLRRLGRLAPSVVPLAAARVRGQARPSREHGLHHAIELPREPVHLGRGQVLDVHGWAVHTDLPISSLSIVVDGTEHRASYGYKRVDVVHALEAQLGITVAQGSGMRARIPLTAVEADRVAQVLLRVRLTDGTVLERELPALHLHAGTGAEPSRIRWHGTGPRVAVCLPAHQPSAELLSAQVDALRAQTHTNWVCLISDDASAPRARAAVRELIAGDERFVLVEHERHVGMFGNTERALGLVPADAQFVALSDQDVVWDKDKLESLLAGFTEDRVQLVYSDARLLDERQHVLTDSLWGERPNQWQDLESLLLFNTVTSAAAMVRADLVRERVLPFPLTPPSMSHDHWLAVAALAAGRLSFVDRPLQTYRQRGGEVPHWQPPWSPGTLTVLLAGIGRDRLLGAEDLRLLDGAAVDQLPGLAQFAGTLLLRNRDRLGEHTRADLLRLTLADHARGAALSLLARVLRGKPDTAGVERYLLATVLRRQAKNRRLQPNPVRRPPTLD
ncbi:glycosyltransferase [Kutzneria albida]|uniref:Glycosyl transferase family 2 n=1 Tax=Kutzneria albida DSM 43870 TaxID=1449976 RepID=W5VX79_9PSEU|nr:glycosyltransferase [Kutzneria albida]AHH93448.1 glycosyl transferase family 2 [Kutzneria albida DSM 43870]